MTFWTNIAISRLPTSGSRQSELGQLLRHRPQSDKAPDICLATPRRFMSLRKLLKHNNAITEMLHVFRKAFEISAEMGLTCNLVQSDHPVAPNKAKLFLSHHTIQTPAFDEISANGVNVIHFKAADIPGRTSFDPIGFAGWSSLAQKTADQILLDAVPHRDIDLFFQSERDRLLGQNISKYEQSSTLDDLPDNYIFIALQTIGDMVQRNAYVPMLDMLDMVIRRFENSPYNIVIKRHPKCKSARVSRALNRYVGHPNIVIAQGSIHKIMKNAAALFTVNSGVGSESIIHNVPIYCFGAADYGPIAHHIRTYNELLVTTDPIHTAYSFDHTKAFLYHYRNIYQVKLATRLEDKLRQLIKEAID